MWKNKPPGKETIEWPCKSSGILLFDDQCGFASDADASIVPDLWCRGTSPQGK